MTFESDEDFYVPMAVIAVANHIHRQGVTPRPWIVDFLGAVDRKFPGLSFRDFCDAVRLCDLGERQPSGSA
jgi:hypothetical protein